MGFIFAAHLPIAGVALLPLPFGLRRAGLAKAAEAIWFS
jgi:hypothetical protein